MKAIATVSAAALMLLGAYALWKLANASALSSRASESKPGSLDRWEAEGGALANPAYPPEAGPADSVGGV